MSAMEYANDRLATYCLIAASGSCALLSLCVAEGWSSNRPSESSIGATGAPYVSQPIVFLILSLLYLPMALALLAACVKSKEVRRRTIASGFAILAFVGFVALLRALFPGVNPYVNELRRAEQDPESAGLEADLRNESLARPMESGPRLPDDWSWAFPALVAAAAVSMLAAYMAASGRKKAAEAACPSPPASREKPSWLPDAPVERPDRAAVIEAYRRFRYAAASVDPSSLSLTPREFLDSITQSSGDSPRSRELTYLFEVARYSDHPVPAESARRAKGLAAELVDSARRRGYEGAA